MPVVPDLPGPAQAPGFGPGLSSAVSAAGDAVSVVLQDAAAAFEAAVAAADGRPGPRDDAPATGAVLDEATDEPARPRPRILPDPPAWPDEPGASSIPADPWAQAGDQAKPFGSGRGDGRTGLRPIHATPARGEQNPT